MPLVMFLHGKRRPRRTGELARVFGAGLVAGATAAVSAMSSRKAVTAAKVGTGHPVKHRRSTWRPVRCSRSTRWTP